MGYGERYCRILAWPIHIFHDFKSSGRFFFSLHSVAWPPVGVDIWIRKVKLLLLRTDAKDIEGIPWILELSLHDGIAGCSTKITELVLIEGHIAPPANAVHDKGELNNTSAISVIADLVKHVRLVGIVDQLHFVKLPNQLRTQPLLHITNHGKLVHKELEALSVHGMDPDFKGIW